MKQAVNDEVERWIEHLEHVARVNDEVAQLLTVTVRVRPDDLDEPRGSLAEDEEKDDEYHHQGDASLALAAGARCHHQSPSPAQRSPVGVCH